MMYRHVFGFLGLSIFLLAAACAPELQTDGTGGTGGAGAAGGMGGTGGTGGLECTSAADCADNECKVGPSCNAGVCEWTTVNMPGTPVGAQIYGDCKVRECDATGNVTETEIDGDFYDFVDPCYQDGCSAGASPQPDPGKQCTTKWGKVGLCGDAFNCIECAVDADCSGYKCTSIGRCVPLHCLNGVFDSPSGETDIDCGGPCTPCAAGLKCNQRSDCEGEGLCIGSPKVCQVPTCSDAVQNGNETDSDCGGNCAEDVADPKRCSEGQGCLFPNDCAAGLSCKSGTCQP
ncbi:hypothetical protein [Polyangium mundeleinium]|uniref:Tryptophan synthase alpha chain n=1 Tax=Polyangium mundeleinium TaxID=2995306 RepID=A0ABT5EKR4_9BACT|nr:hypothetical protein [Polyangium mundeleinium]MDC0742381.1 hypothetical protein [Polyangium mundeleinium]